MADELAGPSTESASGPLNEETASVPRRRRLLPALGFLVVFLALAGGAYFIKTGADDQAELRREVEWLSSEVNGLESQLTSLERQVSILGSDVADRATSSELRSVEGDLDVLADDVCGSWGCSFRFGSIDDDLEDLTDCVNAFIDAWATNGRTFYCG